MKLQKTYDSVHHYSLYNIMHVFCFHKKLIYLTNVYLERTIKMDDSLMEKCIVMTGLKQDDVLLPFVFNIENI